MTGQKNTIKELVDIFMEELDRQMKEDHKDLMDTRYKEKENIDFKYGRGGFGKFVQDLVGPPGPEGCTFTEGNTSEFKTVKFTENNTCVDKNVTSSSVSSNSSNSSNSSSSSPVYKYHEGSNIHELHEYINKTYAKDYHYVGTSEDLDIPNIQSFDVWHARDPYGAEATHANTAIKYLMRYGKKGGYNRDDLLKAMHYILMLMFYNDLRKENKL